MSHLTHVVALETSCRLALPALQEERVGGWLLRVSGGETKRVNSANPIMPGAKADEAKAAAERLYKTHGLPCRFRLTPLAHRDSDRALADAGYDVADPSITMVAPLIRRPFDPALTLSPRADVAWLARTEPLSGRSPAAAAIQARLLTAMPGPLALALLDEGDGPVAAGYASVGDSRAQLSDIIVAPDRRGRGLGRRLIAGLLGWAHEQGCREAMLQVLETNEVARRLYRSLGFVDTYPYHYRVR